jgi:CRP-like cAMP-binding protein
MERNKEKLIEFILKVYPMLRPQAETIVNYFNEGEIKKNELLFAEGKICKEYHFLDSGFVRAYTFDLDGNDITTAFYSSNQVVCEIFSFFKKVPSKENFQALTDCHTWYISFDDLQAVFHSMPEFREFGRTILVNAYAHLKLRMLSSLHETAEERYKNLLATNPDIFQYAPLKNIASFLGITDSSLSRIRKDFALAEKNN